MCKQPPNNTPADSCLAITGQNFVTISENIGKMLKLLKKILFVYFI